MASAAPLLDGPEDAPYDAEIFVDTPRHIIEQMGGRGERLDACARRSTASGRPASISSCTTTSPPCCAAGGAAGVRHRADLELAPLPGVVPVAFRAAGADCRRHFVVRPRLHEAASRASFTAALQLVDVPASEAVMVGDSVRQDVEGALRAGMRAVLLHRSGRSHPRRARARRLRGVSVISRSVGASAIALDASCPIVPSARLKATEVQKSADCLFYPGGHAMLRPPSRCRWMWNTVWPASRLVLKTVRNPPLKCPAPSRSPPRAAPARRRADRRRAEIVQRRDVPLRHDEHVRRRLRVDVVEGQHRSSS